MSEFRRIRHLVKNGCGLESNLYQIKINYHLFYYIKKGKKMFNFFKKFFYKKPLEKVNPPKIMLEEQEKENSFPQVQGALPSEKQVEEEQKWLSAMRVAGRPMFKFLFW